MEEGEKDMRQNLRNIFLVARGEYVRWLMNPRMIMVLVLVILIREQIIVPMMQAAAEMEQPLNGVEPCIAAANSGLILLLLPLVYLVLTSSFPTVDGNILFYIKRMGRGNWIAGEMLFQVFAALTYCVVFIIVTMAQTIRVSYFANGWSIPVTDYDKVLAEAASVRMDLIVPPNLYFQMPPYKAFLLSYVLLFLFLMLCSMFFLTGCLYSKKLIFFLLLVVQIVLGGALYTIEHKGMWFFPVSHAILRTHYRSYFRKYVFSPWLSIAIFAALILVLAVISYRRAKKVNVDMIGGNLLT